MRRTARTGFSLVEVLLAIMVLGIGVISVAALMPAGIYQQRRSVDDVIAPMVANAAVSQLRAKLAPSDFGLDDDPRLPDGDWPWTRPAFIFAPSSDGLTPGTIDVFNGLAAGGAWEAPNTGSGFFNGIPFNVNRYASAPVVVFTQEERGWPVGRAGPAEYYWDCMFRRAFGRIQVAIVVYRVSDPGGGAARYSVSPNPSNPGVPPLPVWVTLTANGEAWNAYGPSANGDDDAVVADDSGSFNSNFDPTDAGDAWQRPGQWIVDQHGQVHRVVAGRERAEDRYEWVELSRPVPPVPNVAGYWFGPTANLSGAFVEQGVVSDIWFMPNEDGAGRLIVPVYAVVQEL